MNKSALFFLFWCRGALRRPLQPQRWLHRGLQLQGEVRVWLIGHLPLQSGLHSVGQCLEVVFRGRRVEWRAASMQAYHLWSASRGQEWPLPLDERHIDCLEEPSCLFMSFRSPNAFRSKWVLHTVCFISKGRFFWKIKVFLSGAENVSHVTASCSESGIWQPIDFECAFDPLAVNLKEPANFGKSKKTKLKFILHSSMILFQTGLQMEEAAPER